MRKGLASILLAGFSACAPCDYTKLSRLPLVSSVPEEYQDDVTFVKEVRKFGIEQLGLNQCTQHYTTFKKTDGEARTLYRLFVTRPTELPTTWKEAAHYFEHNTAFREDIKAGYFWSYEDTLEDEREYYTKEGYDVYSRNTADFNEPKSKHGSSLTPSFFSSSKERQAEVVLHEICHDSQEGSTGIHLSEKVNEAFCTMFGHVGVAEYFKSRKGADSGEYKEALQSLANYEVYALKISGVYQRLQDLYHSGKPSQQMQEDRKIIFAEVEEILGEEVNNANLWDRFPYVKHFSLMFELYHHQHNNLPQTLQMMKDCPAEEKEALKYIRDVIKKGIK